MVFYVKPPTLYYGHVQKKLKNAITLCLINTMRMLSKAFSQARKKDNVTGACEQSIEC